MAVSVRSVVRVVHRPRLRRLAIAFGLFAIAENATWVAVTVFAFTRGGLGEAGLVSVVQLAPAVVVAPFAAYAGDRFRIDGVIVGGYVTQALAMAATAAAMWAGGSALAVYTPATLTAVAVTFTRPAVAAVLPVVTASPTDLTAAIVTMGILQHLGAFAGPAFAGLALSGGGDPAVVFAAMSGAMLLAAVLATGLRVDRQLARSPIGAGAVLHDALGGFRTLRRERDVRLLVGIASLGAVILGATDVVAVAVAGGLLDASDPARAGVFSAAFGLGALLGAVGSVALVGRTRLAGPMAIAIAISGGTVVAMAAMSHVAPVVVLFLICGAGESVARLAASSLLQRFTPASVLSRVFGVLEGLDMAAMATGAAVATLLLSALGLVPGMVVVGLLVPAAVALAVPRLRRIDAAAPTPRTELVELVRDIPIFAGLGPPTLERLLADVESAEFAAGAVVVREGGEGDRYFIVERGELIVSVGGRTIRGLGPGDGFGEIALLRDVPRTATVTARTPALLHGVRRVDFLGALSGHPGGLGLAHEYAQRLLDDDGARDDR